LPFKTFKPFKRCAPFKALKMHGSRIPERSKRSPASIPSGNMKVQAVQNVQGVSKTILAVLELPESPKQATEYWTH
jgi:hypothetical protein